MSLFNLFGTTPDDTSEEQRNQRPTTRSQSRTNSHRLQLPTDAVSSFNGLARGRRSPSPLAVGHNANSAVIFSYDSTNISQRMKLVLAFFCIIQAHSGKSLCFTGLFWYLHALYRLFLAFPFALQAHSGIFRHFFYILRRTMV